MAPRHGARIAAIHRDAANSAILTVGVVPFHPPIIWVQNKKADGRTPLRRLLLMRSVANYRPVKIRSTNCFTVGMKLFE